MIGSSRRRARDPERNGSSRRPPGASAGRRRRSATDRHMRWSAVRQRPRPAGAAARRAERPTRVTRDHPARPGVKVERPQAAGRPRAVPAGRRRRPRTNDLDAGRLRAGWYSRRVRASAERGRVQGPGRAEADLGPRAVPVARIPMRNSWPPTAIRNCSAGLPAHPDRYPNHYPDPYPDGYPYPYPDGYPGGGVPGEPASACLRWSGRSRGRVTGKNRP